MAFRDARRRRNHRHDRTGFRVAATGADLCHVIGEHDDADHAHHTRHARDADQTVSAYLRQSHRRQSGVALIVALLVVALATVLIAALLYRGELTAARTRNDIRAAQAL